MEPIITRLGGEEKIRALVERFYDLIETAPEGRHILHLHFRGHGMSHVRVEQFLFLCGFLGGRRYYAEQHGHMNLREIHDHVPIRPEDADNWLTCMEQAMDDEQIPEPLRTRLMTTFHRAAHALVNREAGSPAE